MDLGTIFIGLALVILTGAIIIRPLIEHTSRSPSQMDKQRSALQAERDRILTFLEELEMDHTMGKLLEEDFLQERTQLVAQGAEVLRQIDELNGFSMDERRHAEPADELDGELEAAVSRLREQSSDSSAAYCGTCGTKVIPGDLFCVRCGASLSVEGLRE